MIVAYEGSPNDFYFARIVFQDMDTAIRQIWEMGGTYDLHDTEVTRTKFDIAWDLRVEEG